MSPKQWEGERDKWKSGIREKYLREPKGGMRCAFPPLYINYKGTNNKLTDDSKVIKIIISGETEAGSAGE
jgi:hypothetical protein